MHFIITQGYLSPCPRIITQGYGPACPVGGAAPAPSPAKKQKQCITLWSVSDNLSPVQVSHETICFKIDDKTSVEMEGPVLIDLSHREVIGVRIVMGEIIVTTKTGGSRGND